MTLFRDSWWKSIGIPIKTDSRRRKFVYNFYTGTKFPLTEDENREMAQIVYSPKFQEEFCNYLLHTSMVNVIM